MKNKIEPQKGFQSIFLSSKADIAIGGGAAGVGKSFALLLEALRFTSINGFGAVIFRRTTPMIKNKGGLWDESVQIYSALKNPPESIEGKYKHRFYSGATVEFRHMEHEKNRFDWQGSQIPLIGFDELTHFTEEQFFYMLSRNRSTCGVKPYIRCTTNPQPYGWLKDFIGWWLYPDDYEIEGLQGYPIQERAGVLRYMIREKGQIIWGDTKEEVISQCPHIFTDEYRESLKHSNVEFTDLVKSVTFIPGSLKENKLLLAKDPAYLGNLMSLQEEDKVRLLGGCWKVLKDESLLFDYKAISDLFTNDFIKESNISTNKFITADIALEGADLFVIGVWYGFVLIEIKVIEKSDGNQVISEIKEVARKHNVPKRNICYDNDGVGGFVKGWLNTSVPFKNGSKALNGENYENLKTQCYYKLSTCVNNSSIYILDSRYKHEITEELRAISKKPRKDAKEKLKIASKAEIKIKIKRSPDFADMLMMRMYFTLTTQKPTRTTKRKSKSISLS